MYQFFQETAVAKDDVKHANHDGALIEKDVKEDKPVHLLSDWRTTISKQPKVKQPGWQNMEANQGDERIQEAVHASNDVRQRKAVSNKSRINKVVSEEVKSLKSFYLSFINFYFIDTCSANVYSP